MLTASITENEDSVGLQLLDESGEVVHALAHHGTDRIAEVAQEFRAALATLQIQATEQ